jgi:hypothetical protein
MAADGDLQYIVQALCWMGGKMVWPKETIAEQLGRDDDPGFFAELDRAEREGLVEARPEGLLLTDAGWGLAASDEN